MPCLHNVGYGMERDNAWGMFLDAVFDNNKKEIRKSIANLNMLSNEDKHLLLTDINEFEVEFNKMDDESAIKAYCDIKGVASTTFGSNICRIELQRIISLSKEVLNGWST